MPPSSSSPYSSVTRSSNRSNAQHNKKAKENSYNENDADVLKKKTSAASVTKKTNKKAVSGHGKGKKKKVAATTATAPFTNNLESRTKKQRQAELEEARQEKEHVHEKEHEEKDTRLRESMMRDQLIMEQHPEYANMLAHLDEAKADRLHIMEAWRTNERQNAQRQFIAQSQQAWDSFHYAKAQLRASLVSKIQQKIAQLKEEKELFDRQVKARQYNNEQLMLQQQSQQQQQQQQQNELEYENWVPPDRLHAIGSFVTGASYDEINRDIALASARPYPTYAYPYNKRVQHSHTPHLIYSDNESKSVSEEEPTAAVAAATEATRAASVPVPATSTFTPAPSTSDVHPHTAAFSPYTNQPSQPYHSPQAQTLTYSHPHPSPSLYPTPNHHSASQLPSIHRYTYDSNSSSRTAMSPAPPRLSYHLPITYQAGLQSPVYHHAATMTPAPYGNDEPPVGWRSGERTDWYRPRTAA